VLFLTGRRAEALEESGHRTHVAEVRDVAENEALSAIKQQGSGHHRQRGVLGSVDADRSVETVSAVDDELVQATCPRSLLVNYKL
jgi:hypothetical protein